MSTLPKPRVTFYKPVFGNDNMYGAVDTTDIAAFAPKMKTHTPKPAPAAELPEAAE